jgi:dihydroflavonol-4-reductase
MEQKKRSKVLVTGGNGFLGNHIVRQLLMAKYEVKAFVLKGTPTFSLDSLDVETFIGDLMNLTDIQMAMNGCDYLIHTAAVTDVWPAKNRQSWLINFELVQLIIQALKTSSIKKMIHVGTANSFGFGSFEKPGDEQTPFNKGIALFDYILSKKTAQDFLLQQAQDKPPVPVVILNPTFMIGSGDSKPGSGAMIVSLMKGKVPGYTNGGRSFASVKDVASAAVVAIKKGRIGECYIVGGVNLSYRKFFDVVSHVSGIKPLKRFIPTWLAISIAGVLEIVAKLKRRKPVLTINMAKVSGQYHFYDSSKASRELDYQITPIEESIQEAVAWFREHGYVPTEKSQS